MESEIQKVGLIAGAVYLLVIIVFIARSTWSRRRNSKDRRPSENDSGSGACPTDASRWGSGQGGSGDGGYADEGSAGDTGSSW